jgi:predicted amidohydrolase
MIIALASPGIASTLDEGLDKIKRFLSEASAQGAEIACFPEAYLPGLRGQDFDVLPFDQTQQERALQAVAQLARTYAVATILGMERFTPAGRQIAAFVIDAGAKFWAIKPRTSSTRARIRSMYPETLGKSSRSTASSLG